MALTRIEITKTIPSNPVRKSAIWLSIVTGLELRLPLPLSQNILVNAELIYKQLPVGLAANAGFGIIVTRLATTTRPVMIQCLIACFKTIVDLTISIVLFIPLTRLLYK